MRRRRRKKDEKRVKEENEDKKKNKNKGNCAGTDCRIRPNGQGENRPGADVHKIKTEPEADLDGEAECMSVLYRVHTGVSLVSEQEISIDLSDADQGSEVDCAYALTVTEQSKLFSFSFYLTPSPTADQYGEKRDHNSCIISLNPPNQPPQILHYHQTSDDYQLGH